VRTDAGQQVAMSDAVRQALLGQYAAHKSWSVQLHHDNLVALNEAHKKLFMSLAPIANDFSEVAFDFARILFVKYLGPELGMTIVRLRRNPQIVAKIKDPPNIDDLRLPFYTDVSLGLLRTHDPAA
jgi:hypothetical protein